MLFYSSLQEPDPDLQGPFDSRNDGSELELDGSGEGVSADDEEVDNLPITTKKKFKASKTYERRSFLEPKPSFVKGDKRVVRVLFRFSVFSISQNIVQRSTAFKLLNNICQFKGPFN
jgi:hypothetical protein